MKKAKVFQNEGGKRQRKKRIALLGLFFLLGFSIVTYRCLYLHLTHDTKLEKIARSQYRATIHEAPPRGNIYDADGEELAVSLPAYSVAARPAKIKDPGEVYRILGSALGLTPGQFNSNIGSGRKYVWLKRHLAVSEEERRNSTRLEGIEWVKGSRRFYPNREVASQLLGAVGQDNEGLGGLELFYDRYLRGGDESSEAYRDARGRMFETEETISEVSRDSHNLFLTIRKNIQYTMERELNAACNQYRAKACTAIVMEPATGSVLAMSSYPNFNPNSYESSNLNSWRNRSVTDTFEPGSTLKTILAAAALESGTVRASDRFFCENGELRIGKHIIHDHEKYGTLTFRDILKVSSNIGIYKVGQKVGRKAFSESLDLFGFGRKTGIDYPGEVSGFVPPVKSWQEIEFATISFGQGVRVTPLQLTSAYAAIANGGVRMRPTLVSRVTDSEGKTVLHVEPKALGRILKEETSRNLLEMMEEVTREGGTATLAALPGYTVAGKTGTAQKVVNGRYSKTQFMSSFIGIVPAEDPKLVILVAIDEPQGVIYGGLVAAPVFRKIAWASLRELGVPPKRSNVPGVTEAGLLRSGTVKAN